MNRYKFVNDQDQHLHTLDGKALIGTSTIAKGVGKGDGRLSWWAAGKACETMGWIKPVKDQTDKWAVVNEQERLNGAVRAWESICKMSSHLSYLELLDKAYRAHATNLKKTAKSGVDLHAFLETFIRFEIDELPFGQSLCSMDGWKQIEPFIEWSKKNVKQWLFSEIHVFSLELGVGGIIDCGYIDKDNCFCIGDFKSGGAWYSGMTQIGGYDIQFFENGGVGFDANGEVAYRLDLNIDTIGKKHVIFPFKNGFKQPVISTDVDANRESFRCATILYKNQMAFEKMIEARNGKS